MISIITVVLFIAFSIIPQSAGSDSFRYNVDAYIEKADAFYLEGKYREALNEANKAIALRPEDPRGYNYIIAIHIAEGDYRIALEASKRYLAVVDALDSLDANSLTRHASLLENVMGYKETMLFLQKYQRIFPRTVEKDIEGLKKANAQGRNYYNLSP